MASVPLVKDQPVDGVIVHDQLDTTLYESSVKKISFPEQIVVRSASNSALHKYRSPVAPVALKFDAFHKLDLPVLETCKAARILFT